MAYVRYGIDVAEHQGVLDWKAIKDEGKVRFAILRCGYGSDYTNQDDGQFENNVRGCEENKIPYGVYIYSYATNTDMAKSEAEHVKRQLKKCGSWFRLGAWYDVEEQSQLNLGGQMNDILNAWRTAMGKPKNCRRIGLYVNPNFLNNCFRNISDDVPLWVACWGGDKPTGDKYKNMVIWQWGTAKGLNGTHGDVDGDYCYISIFHDYLGGKKTTSTSTNKNTKSIAELAQEVLDGKWGNGDERKQKLEKAGYDYSKVQAKVNELVAAKNSYKAKVKATSGLNCRSGAGSSYPVVKAYPYGTVLTITETSSGWGKTSDGWVSLEWVEKI